MAYEAAGQGAHPGLGWIGHKNITIQTPDGQPLPGIKASENVGASSPVALPSGEFGRENSPTTSLSPVAPLPGIKAVANSGNTENASVPSGEQALANRPNVSLPQTAPLPGLKASENRGVETATPTAPPLLNQPNPWKQCQPEGLQGGPSNISYNG